MAVHIGTSGWSYDHWVDVLCPRKASSLERLDAYALAFNTVEVNNTFYRWPSKEVFTTWHERLPKGFITSIKASRGLTLFRKLNDPQPWLDRMEADMVRLREKRGVLLFQLPPHFGCDIDQLDRFLKSCACRPAHCRGVPPSDVGCGGDGHGARPAQGGLLRHEWGKPAVRIACDRGLCLRPLSRAGRTAPVRGFVLRGRFAMVG